MNFSLHSFDGHPGSQDKEGYVRSILSFIREATSQSDLIVSLRLWNLTQDNKTNAEIQKNRELLSIIENEFDLSYQIEEKLTPGKGIKIAERVFINQDYEFQWPALHEEEDDGKGFCHGLRNQAGILANGTVIPCCLDGEGLLTLGILIMIHFLTLSKVKEQQTLSMDFRKELRLKNFAGNVDIANGLGSKYEISPHKARAYFYT